ncbi:MAG: amidohydrolase family protein [Alphaproteobacteria bacterium]|nr:amidohydrolase family protein [Alphaproteobacteria bacterium]
MTDLINGPDWHPKKPNTRPPPLSCDTHAHLYGPFTRFPIDPIKGDGPDTSYKQYKDMLDVLGIERAVLVQARDYGGIDPVTVDAIEKSAGRIRGVAAMPREALEDHLDFLISKNFCGIRLSTFSPGAVRLDHLESIAPLIDELGWAILLHLSDIEEVIDLAPRVRMQSANILFDHLGRVRGPDTLQSPGFQTLLTLLKETDNCWVKICSWYRLSADGSPYDDMTPYAHALIMARPDRIVWGSNWPHPNSTAAIPNDGNLLDQFMDWAGNENTQRQILVDNPTRLFGFESTD